jgi:hypothetical protein
VDAGLIGMDNLSGAAMALDGFQSKSSIRRVWLVKRLTAKNKKKLKIISKAP